MIWYDLERLEKEFIEGSVSEKSGFNYLLAISLLYVVGTKGGGDGDESYWLSAIGIAVDVALTVITLRAAYGINLRGDNKEFLKRYLGLSFVVSIRLLVYLLLIMVIGVFVGLALERTGAINENIKDIASLGVNVAGSVIFYFMLTASFKRVNTTRDKAENVA